MFRCLYSSLAVVSLWLILGYFGYGHSQSLDLDNPAATEELEDSDNQSATTTKKPLFQARLNSSLIYSDNIRLSASGEEDDDLVFEIRPGFTVQRESSRLDAKLDYDMHNFYFSNSGRTDTHHQLRGIASLELLAERFFLDTEVFFREELEDGRNNLGSDLISNPEEFSEVYGFRISPLWRDELGDFADLELRYTYDNVHQQRNVADSQTHSFEIDLSDGRQFSILDWNVNYFRQILKRQRANREPQLANNDDTGSTQKETFLAQVEYPLDDVWAVAGRVGYENSDVIFQQNERDGSFWSLGVLWTPSRFFDVSAFYGPSENEFDFRYSPTSRTSLQFNRLDRDVGLIIGSVWSGSLSHRTRFSNWTASYSEGTISGAELEFEEAFVPFEDTENIPPIIANLQNQSLTTEDIFTSTSSDFERKRFQTRISYNRARTFASLGGFHERRDFRTDEISSETGYGVLTSVARIINPRTVSLFSINWQHSELEDNNDDNDLLILRATLAYAFTRDLSASLIYRYAQLEANDSAQDFQENRFGALMRLNF